MLKYLQSVGIKYQLEPFIASDEFTLQKVREAATMFEYFLGKAKIACGGFAQVTLIGGVATESFEERLDVINYAHPYEYLNRLSSDANVTDVQSKFIHEIVAALIRLGEPRGWDIDAISKLHQHVTDKKFQFDEIWAKPKFNSSRTYAVGVGWKTDKDTELAFLVTRAGSDSQTWYKIMNLKTGLGLIETILGKFGWEGDRFARLWNTNKRDFWELDTESMRVDFHYGPAKSGNAHGQYALGKMYLDGDSMVNKDYAKAIEWLKKSADQNFVRAKQLLQTI